jgi:hypothetical protein
MARPGVLTQASEVRDESRSERVEMNIPRELQEIPSLFADDGPVAILKEVPVPLVPPIEVDCESREKFPHGRRKGLSARPEQ